MPLYNLDKWRPLIHEFIIHNLRGHQDKSILDIGFGSSTGSIRESGLKPDTLDKNKFDNDVTHIANIMDAATLGNVPQYDIVSACELLEHCESLEAPAKNIMSLVKPGGFALITMPCFLPHHPGAHFYGDYFRVMPTGLTQLFSPHRVVETIYPSDIEGMPYGIGAIVYKAK